MMDVHSTHHNATTVSLRHVHKLVVSFEKKIQLEVSDYVVLSFVQCMSFLVLDWELPSVVQNA